MNDELRKTALKHCDIEGKYERNLNHAWLSIEIDEIYKEDYQMRMLNTNTLKRLLPVQGQGREERSSYRYEISGKLSMKSFYENTVLGYREMESFMKQFVEALREVENLLLNPNGLLLVPDYIYQADGQFYFCFCPCKCGDIWDEFHQLTEYFVKKADYEDKEAIYLSYELHKASMEQNYNIEKVLEEILEKKDTEVQKMSAEKDNTYAIEEDYWIDDWEGEQEMLGSKIKEKRSVWGMVNEKLQKRRKKMWGDWDTFA